MKRFHTWESQVLRPNYYSEYEQPILCARNTWVARSSNWLKRGLRVYLGQDSAIVPLSVSLDPFNSTCLLIESVQNTEFPSRSRELRCTRLAGWRPILTRR